MATKVEDKDLRKLYLKLESLEKEKKETILLIRKHPVVIQKYLDEEFKNIINENKWYINNDHTGYAQSVDNKKETIKKLIRIECTTTPPINNDRIYINLIYQYLDGHESSQRAEIIFVKPIKPQFFLNMTEISENDLKKIKKEIELLEKNSEKNKKIQEIEKQMQIMQKELLELKRK